MCGRLALFSDPTTLARHFGLTGPFTVAPRWSIAPGRPLCIVRLAAEAGAPGASDVAWGFLPPWADPAHPGPRPINARSETAAGRPLFRAAWRQRRCLVPADGWYEWTAGRDGKDPWFFSAPDGGPLGLAGLWSRWRGSDGRVVESAAILTRAALDPLAAIHPRMPLVIDRADYAAWLDPAQPPAPTLLDGACARRVRARRVSRRVNSPAHDGPDLLAAATDLPA
jgi:putative SOS response-associated peptidase YedK